MRTTLDLQPTQTKSNTAVSIIIPAYREAGAVGSVVSKVRDVFETLQISYEIIVIDDGSGDTTAAEAERSGAVVVVHPYNRGYGSALKTGIRVARGETVIMLDADGQHDPADVERLLVERKCFDMVVGARVNNVSPFWRKPGKKFVGWLAAHLSGHEIPDLNSGFRAMNREMVLRFLPIMPDGFSFSTTSTIAVCRGGYTVCYVPIKVSPRIGKSTVKIRDGLNTIMLIIRIVTLFSPLRVFLPVAAATFILGTMFIIHGYLTIGEASLKGIMVLLAAILFFFFGILVDQISAIRRGEHVK